MALLEGEDLRSLPADGVLHLGDGLVPASQLAQVELPCLDRDLDEGWQFHHVPYSLSAAWRLEWQAPALLELSDLSWPPISRMEAKDLNCSAWGGMPENKNRQLVPSGVALCIRGQPHRQFGANEVLLVRRLRVDQPAIVSADKQEVDLAAPESAD